MLNMTHVDTVGPFLTGEMLNFFNPHLGTAVNVAQIRGPLIMTAANDRLRHFGYQQKKKVGGCSGRLYLVDAIFFFS